MRAATLRQPNLPFVKPPDGPGQSATGKDYAMSLFNTMRTSVSGMAAQSNALSAISDNIANSGTTGYKRASAEFETLLGENATSNYESGGVRTDIRYGVSDQGTLTTTTSATDLAISGNGFFTVSQGGQGTYLTRAGSFVPDSSGNLVNTAGYSLMGYAMTTSGTASTLSVVNVSNSDLQAASSTSGTLSMNLPSTATASTADLPSSNQADSHYTDKTSVTVYGALGTTEVLDVYLTKTGANSWEATAYKQSDAASGGGFPYASAAIGTANLTFDGTTGKLTSGSPKALNLTVDGASVPIDLSATTQLATDFGVTQAQANGNAPSKLDHIQIGTDGVVTAVYASGVQVSTYKIPLATVQSPDNLTTISGDVYQASADSGNPIWSTAGTNGAGKIVSDALEQSTVDLATELTNMIQAQRGYEANSKVLQTASDLLSVLNRLTTN
jgi:flagellar hook protein FlgE